MGCIRNDMSHFSCHAYDKKVQWTFFSIYRRNMDAGYFLFAQVYVCMIYFGRQ